MLVITDSQQIALKVKPETKAGNPAKIDGVPEWSSSDESVVVMTPSEDGLSCDAVGTGKLGTCQVQVTADADIGEGVETITQIETVEVRAGKAVKVGIEAGAVTERSE